MVLKLKLLFIKEKQQAAFQGGTPDLSFLLRIFPPTVWVLFSKCHASSCD